jgi:hypothetical protein
MTGSPCDETRELVPELALGIADGEERARVLEHAATCADCRRELEELAALSEELLVLATAAEPPVGFELRVLESIAPPAPERRRPRLRPVLGLAAAAVAAAAVTAGALLLAGRDDRRLADHYRSVLAEAHGSYLGAVRLRDAAGREGGVLFVYRGKPSWLMVTVDPALRARAARIEVLGRDGRALRFAWARLSEGTWAGPADPARVSGVRVLDREGRALLTARP